MSDLPHFDFGSLPQWTLQPYEPIVHQHSWPQSSSSTEPLLQDFYNQHGFSKSQAFYSSRVPVRELPIKRKRTSKPKVRTGCITCKIRRVKCDETRPSCKRCTSTGRKCDGYDHVTKINSTTDTPSTLVPHRLDKVNTSIPSIYVATSSPPLSIVFAGTVQERRAFHRFRYRTVPSFAGGSEGEFWTRLVLQACTSEAVIRDAAIALGTLHEFYEDQHGTYDQSVLANSTYQDAVALYGKAIRQLYQRIDISAGETARLAVIASILFACFEVLRRSNMAAVVHYQSGMRALLDQMRQQPDRVTRSSAGSDQSSTIVLRQAPQDDLDQMLRVFARYDVQACTFSKPRVEVLDISLPAVPTDDIHFSEVRRYLDNLLLAAYQLVKSDLSMFRYWKSEKVPLTWHERRDNALTTFQCWLDALERSIPSDIVTLRQHGIVASKSILGLILQIKIAMIMLRTSIDCGRESMYDQFTPDFEEIVSRVETLTESLNLKPIRPLDHETVPFSMELGITHPLFFVAWKCRSWKLRRRAIAELKKAGKEGVWEGPIMAVVAERIHEIESEGLRAGETIPEKQRIHDIRKGIEYDERVVRVEMRLASDDTWENWTVLREAIPF